MGNSQSSKRDKCVAFFHKLFKTKFQRLIGAIKVGNLNRVKYYFSNKVNFTRYTEGGDTPLHVAVKYNRTEIVKFICENLSNLNLNDRNFAGDTPLLIASMNGNFEIVRYLITLKADPDITENKGYTAFIAACANGNVDIIKCLVDRGGANYKLKGHDGQTGLHRAAFYGNYEVLVYLIKELKMNVMVPDRKGNLPLHLACLKLNMACARLLIKASSKESGAALYVKNKYGISALDTLVRQFNRLRGPEENEEFRVEEIEEYLKDKNNYPRRKAKQPSIGPSVLSYPRPSIMDRASDLKRKLKDFFNRNSIFGTQETPRLPPESDSFSTPRPNNFENFFDNEANSARNPQASNDEEFKLEEENNGEMGSEELRFSGSATRLLSPQPQEPFGFQTFGNQRKGKPAKAAGLFLSRLSTIRKGERSPTSVFTSQKRLSVSIESPENSKMLKRSASSSIKSDGNVAEETKPALQGHFATRTKSRFAFQNN